MHTLPFSKEAEQAILGSLIVDFERVIELVTKQGICVEHFFLRQHNLIFGLLDSLYRSNEPVDLLTIGEKAKESGVLDKIGGYDYIETLIDTTPTSAHAEYYIDILIDRQIRRAVIEHAQTAISEATNLESTAESVLAKAQGDLHLMRTEDRESKESLSAQIIEAYEMAERGEVAGVITPFAKVDEHMGGIPLRAVTPFIGRSGAGKSMVKAWWEHRCLKNGVPFLDMAFEDKDKAMSRLACSIAGASDYHLRSGNAFDGHKELAIDALERITQSDIAHFKTVKRDIDEVCAQIRYHSDVFGVKLVFIDGFKDIARPAKFHNDTGYEEHMSQMLCDCADKCNVAIVPIIHLRKIENDRLITDGDMRGSGLIYSDARCLIALQNAGINEMFSERGETTIPESRVFDILKNNYGPSASCAFNINFNLQKCDEL